jgi:hypothetical protein
MEFKLKHTIDGKETLFREELSDGDFIKVTSLVSQAWAEFCENKGWSSNISDRYTAGFEAFDESGKSVYYESFGE